MNIICSLCKQPLPPSTARDDVRYQEIGWARDRVRGGTNALELRERTGAVAHARCVREAKSPQSEQLFD